MQESLQLKHQVMHSELGPVVISPADVFVEPMIETTDPRRRLKLAEAALAADSDCIQAYLSLAELTRNSAQSSALVAKALKIGMRIWGRVAPRREIAWWDNPSTRPYMRALLMTADLMADHGDEAVARRFYEDLLEMDPQDRLGVRERIGNIAAMSCALSP